MPKKNIEPSNATDLETPRNPEVEAMTPALRRHSEILKKALQDLGREDALLKFRIGELVVDIGESPKKFGAKGVELLAIVVGLDPSSLYDFGRVAACWTRKEFLKMLKQEGPRGRALSFSHFVEIAGSVKDEGARHELVALAVANQLSVRELRNEMSQRSSGTTDEAGQSDMGQVDVLAPPVKTWAAGISRWEANLSRIERERLTPKALSTLRDSLVQQQALMTRIRNLIELTQALVGAHVIDRDLSTDAGGAA